MEEKSVYNTQREYAMYGIVHHVRKDDNARDVVRWYGYMPAAVTVEHGCPQS